MQTSKRFSMIVPFLAFLLAFGQIGCGFGKDNIEKANLKFITGVRAARQISTAQYNDQRLTAEAYKARLLAFDKVYKTDDSFAELFVKYDNINPANKQEFLDAVQLTLDAVAGLVASGNVGVKNDKTQEKFISGLKVAYAIASSAKIAIAAIQKPVAVAGVKVEKM